MRARRLTLSGDEYSTSQLTDPRLKDRHWELRGTPKANGGFDVLRLFTIKDGELFRVTYFCGFVISGVTMPALHVARKRLKSRNSRSKSHGECGPSLVLPFCCLSPCRC
jgi:hypothetical protein